MRLKRLWIDGFKNLNDFEIDFSDKEGITVLIGNNGSGKSNVLEAISAIFTGLFKMSTPQRKPKFEYEIEYVLNDDEHYHMALKKHGEEYRYDFHKNLAHIQTTTFKANPTQYLPSSLIAIYSGEEMRLWEEYYRHLYSDFMIDIQRELHFFPVPKLFYINKFYWDIALLTLLYSSFDNNKEFCKRILKLDDLESINIKIKFNRDNITNFETNTVTAFIDNLSDNNAEKNYTLSEIKELDFIGTEKEFFLKLMASAMSKGLKYKLIDSLEIIFGEDNLNVDALSEGEKKQILLRIALEVVADENSLILFDEPDANIHVANKGQIKDMLEEYSNRENILTTHSPTLMNKFENHLVYLNNGSVEGLEKAEILREITSDTMSFAEQQIVLNTRKDLILTEGKTDIEYIKIALSKLKGEYQELNFEYIPVGGTDNLQHFIEKFDRKEGQTLIAILDRDDAGKKALKQVFGVEKDIDTFTYELKENIYIVVYPKTDNYENSNFLVEDYFSRDIVQEMAKDIVDGYSDSFKSYPNISKQIKQKLPTKCVEFEKEKFNGFRKLFDLIKEIKYSS